MQNTQILSKKYVWKMEGSVSHSDITRKSTYGCMINERMYIIREICFINISGAETETFQDPFYKHRLTFIPSWINNHIPSKVWDEITYAFPNFNGCTVEVCVNGQVISSRIL